MTDTKGSVNIVLEHKNNVLEGLFRNMYIKISELEDMLSEKLSNSESASIIREVKKKSSKPYGLLWETRFWEQDKERESLYLQSIQAKNINTDKGKLEHLFVEGDNLDSLHLLLDEHEESIDVIYIDPPYNTGSNRDFVYNNVIKNTTDKWKHSEWLRFMHPRLALAEKFLSNQGVIFLSIDDNEYAQLKLLCDKVFGESNYLGSIIQDKGNAQNNALSIQKNHEYILVYKKGTVDLVNKLQDKIKVNKEDGKYWYRGSGLTTGGGGGILNNRHTMGYTIYYNEQTGDKLAIQDYDLELAKVSNNESAVYTDERTLLSKGYVAIRPPKRNNKLGRWTWSLDKFNRDKDLIGINKTTKGYSVYIKVYVDTAFKDGRSYYYIKDKEQPSKSILSYPTAQGTTSLVNIFGDNVFNNPKNTELIKYLIRLHPNRNAKVLDFFAGSGTTGHSVMELNREDGGSRQFILCTNNEVSEKKEISTLVEKGFIRQIPKPKRSKEHKDWLNELDTLKQTERYKQFSRSDDYLDLGIARSVTRERIAKVINGYTTPKGLDVEGLTENTLRYFKVSDSTLDTY